MQRDGCFILWEKSKYEEYEKYRKNFEYVLYKKKE